MEERDVVSVKQAADKLGVSEAAVRKQIRAGRLRASKRGRDWWLDARVIERRARQGPGRGRPMSAAMAWAILLMASRDPDASRQAVDRQRYQSRLRAWLNEHSLVDEAPRLRSRADVEEFDAHDSELERILRRPDVLGTGISATDVIGLVGGSSAVEVYAPTSHRARIIDDHFLEPGPGPVRIRWAPDPIWPLLDNDGDGRAPLAAVLLDLLENDDPRARREAARALAAAW